MAQLCFKQTCPQRMSRNSDAIQHGRNARIDTYCLHAHARTFTINLQLKWFTADSEKVYRDECKREIAVDSQRTQNKNKRSLLWGHTRCGFQLIGLPMLHVEFGVQLNIYFPPTRTEITSFDTTRNKRSKWCNFVESHLDERKVLGEKQVVFTGI